MDKGQSQTLQKQQGYYHQAQKNQQFFYLMGFKLQPEVHATKLAMDINDAHKQLGHVGKDILCKMMNYYGIKLSGRLEACNGCMHARAKAQSTKIQTETVAQEPGEWIIWMLLDHFHQLSMFYDMMP